MESNLTVIISLCNTDNPSWFYQAAVSVLNQTIIPDVLIITIDGEISAVHISKVNFLKLKYTDINIELVKSNINQGRGYLLRLAVEYSKTKYIAIMDADDISHSDRFEKELNMFKIKDVDVVGSWVNEASPTSLNIYAIRSVPQEHKEIHNFSKYRSPINHMTVMFKRSAVISAGNYESFPLFEDMWLWCRMLHNGNRFYNIQESLVTARAGKEMHIRRLGSSYAIQEVTLIISLYKMGFYNIWNLLINLLSRIPFRFLPKVLYSLIFSSVILRRRPPME